MQYVVHSYTSALECMYGNLCKQKFLDYLQLRDKFATITYPLSHGTHPRNAKSFVYLKVC